VDYILGIDGKCRSMPGNTQLEAEIEALMASCVDAGVAARRARAQAQAARIDALARRAKPTDDELAQIGSIDAEAERLNRAFIAAQLPLAQSSRKLFHRRMAEVRRRIKARLP
jgi:hypothetical protein